MINTEILEELKKLKAIADVGLLYCKNDYDKESIDGKWSLPGYSADVGSGPQETAFKEFKEETLLNVTAILTNGFMHIRRNPFMSTK